MDPDTDFLQNEIGPVHDDSNLIDSPDYLVQLADEIIYQLRAELSQLKTEIVYLTECKQKYDSLLVTLGLELNKLETTPKTSVDGCGPATDCNE